MLCVDLVALLTTHIESLVLRPVCSRPLKHEQSSSEQFVLAAQNLRVQRLFTSHHVLATSSELYNFDCSTWKESRGQSVMRYNTPTSFPLSFSLTTPNWGIKFWACLGFSSLSQGTGTFYTFVTYSLTTLPPPTCITPTIKPRNRNGPCRDGKKHKRTIFRETRRFVDCMFNFLCSSRPHPYLLALLDNHQKLDFGGGCVELSVR